jgi:uncharacterized protein
MALFVGREYEIAELLKLKRKKSASLVVCKGRRRIGKSTFIRRCGEDFDRLLAFEGLAPRAGLGSPEQLAAFATQLGAQTELPSVTLVDWPQAFKMLNAAIPAKGWTLVLLDEISWMSIGDRDFAGHLKAAWDGLLSRHPRLVVVLCGSVSSWLDRNILSGPGFVGRCSLTLTLEQLPLVHCNAFWRGKRVTSADKLKLLAVTGGVPRYLEEIDPGESAEQNIHRLCFQPGGLLFRELDQIFHDVFDRRADTYRAIVETLVEGPRTVSEISNALGLERGGTLVDALNDLVLAGFVARDLSFDPRTARPRPRALRFRLADNYVRFHLKLIAPRRSQIEKKLYRRTPVETLLAWDTILPLQVQNLVLASFETVRAKLGLEHIGILDAGPYAQSKTLRQRACQVDLLVRTRRSLYVVEVKVQDRIDRAVIDEVQEKVARIASPKNLSVRTGLVYVGELDPRIVDEDYFDTLLPFDELLEP